MVSTCGCTQYTQMYIHFLFTKTVEIGSLKFQKIMSLLIFQDAEQLAGTQNPTNRIHANNLHGQQPRFLSQF